MRTAPGGSLTLAIPLVVTAIAPDFAEAAPCYIPCSYVDGWEDLVPRNADKIPSDGVLVLQGSYLGGDVNNSFDNITLEVTRDGQPIAGALEPTPHPGTLVWRPGEPWVPGATYQLAGVVTNPSAGEGCVPTEFPLAADIVIDTVPGAALAPAEFTGAATLQSTPIINLDTLACCEGSASPILDYGDCYSPSSVEYDETQCTPTAATGSFTLDLTGAPAADGPAAAQLVYSLEIDGFARSTSLDPGARLTGLTAPTCARFSVTDLASGAVTSSEAQCFGDDLADQLGDQTLDPAEALSCALEQCAVNGEGTGWDRTMCGPPGADPETGADPDPEKDTGCGCDSTTPGPTAALALVALLALRRRRTT